MEITSGDTALVLTDPQNDFLSPQGVTWEQGFGVAVVADATAAAQHPDLPEPRPEPAPREVPQ